MRAQRSNPVHGKILCCLIAAVHSMALAACTISAPGNRQDVAFTSTSYGFIDQIGDTTSAINQGLRAYLMVPDGAPPAAQWPAVVILHDGAGVNAQDLFYARQLNDWGYAALIVDSFRSRGITQSLRNQLAVSEASILADAYAALGYLAENPQIDPARIAVLGFSKGGLPALLAALKRYQKPLAAGGPRFAAHIVYYPWCNISLHDVETTGAPVLVMMGDRDEVMRSDTCTTLIDAMRADSPGTEITLVLYPGAGHSFDNPTPGFSWIGSARVIGDIPRHCHIEETAPNRFIEKTSGNPLSTANFQTVMRSCSIGRADVVYDGRARAQSLEALHRFLDQNLLPVSDQRAILKTHHSESRGAH